MTIESLKEIIEFDTELDDDNIDFYIKMKGIAIHENIIKYLGYDSSNSNVKVPWSKVSGLLRYDKKLRDKLYKYLATIEEYIRAFIEIRYGLSPSDLWIINEDSILKSLKESIIKKNLLNIKKRVLNSEKLSDILQDIDFGTLINLTKFLPLEDRNTMFGDNKNINDNLDALRVLRNAVSHHKFLLKCNLNKCYVDNSMSNTLEQNIKNLRQLLPENYRYGKNGNGGITADIYKCKFAVIDEKDNYKNKIFNVDIKHIINI